MPETLAFQELKRRLRYYEQRVRDGYASQACRGMLKAVQAYVEAEGDSPVQPEEFARQVFYHWKRELSSDFFWLHDWSEVMSA